MDVFNKDIGGDKEGLLSHLDHSDIITKSLDQGRIRGSDPFSDSVNESELTDLLKILFFCFQLRTLVRNGFKPFPTKLLILFLASAIFSTSSICLTGIKLIFFRTYGGRSMKSLLFR